MISVFIILDPQRPHRPTEVVRIHRELGDSVMNVPVLAEAVGLACLATVLVAVGAVMALNEGGVDLAIDL